MYSFYLELKWKYGWILCRIFGHDWHYFSMTRLDGTHEYFRCCLRCEHTDDLPDEPWVRHEAGDSWYGDDDE